jgi:hypothetical protein
VLCSLRCVTLIDEENLSEESCSRKLLITSKEIGLVQTRMSFSDCFFFRFLSGSTARPSKATDTDTATEHLRLCRACMHAPFAGHAPKQCMHMLLVFLVRLSNN